MTPTLNKAETEHDSSANEPTVIDPNLPLDLMPSPEIINTPLPPVRSRKSLIIEAYSDNHPLSSTVPAEVLLDWCKDIDEADGAQITPKRAEDLLEIFIPVVCQKGKNYWVAGDVRFSKYLLKQVRPNTKIYINKLRADHPLARIKISTQLLLREPAESQKFEQLQALLKTLRPKKPISQNELAYLLRKTQSTISRLLKKVGS